MFHKSYPPCGTMRKDFFDLTQVAIVLDLVINHQGGVYHCVLIARNIQKVVERGFKVKIAFFYATHASDCR